VLIYDPNTNVLLQVFGGVAFAAAGTSFNQVSVGTALDATGGAGHFYCFAID